MNVTFDNLGGNSSLGFVESFAAHFFCRICTVIKEETKLKTREDSNMLRSRESYDEIVSKIVCGEQLDFKESRGITRFCYLNNLKYFHIVDNFNLDIFHDLMEGSIPLLLEQFIRYGISGKVFTEREIVDAFSFFDYGPLNKKCIPSTISLTKRNIGQNASQTRCVMFNIPFVLNAYKDNEKLSNAWKCIGTMMKIIRIVYSPIICEDDLKMLEDLISDHLNSVIECFHVELIPKQHFMTHMPTAIRMVGPLIHNSTLKFEMKHKVFSSYVRKTQNYKNVSKSLAENYQLKTLSNCYQNKIATGRKMRLNIDDNYKDLFEMFDLGKWTELRSLTFNSDHYEKGLYLKNEDFFYKIEKVFLNELDYFFLCVLYNSNSFDDFLNSRNIEENIPKKYELLCHSQMSYKKSHSERKLGNNLYIISESIQI